MRRLKERGSREQSLYQEQNTEVVFPVSRKAVCWETYRSNKCTDPLSEAGLTLKYNHEEEGGREDQGNNSIIRGWGFLGVLGLAQCPHPLHTCSLQHGKQAQWYTWSASDRLHPVMDPVGAEEALGPSSLHLLEFYLRHLTQKLASLSPRYHCWSPILRTT